MVRRRNEALRTRLGVCFQQFGLAALAKYPRGAIPLPVLVAVLGVALWLSAVPTQAETVPRGLASPLASAGPQAWQPRVIGEPLPRIVCPEGYEAFLLASGFASPDGLAFDPDGFLHVAEEGAGRVSRIDPAGTVTFVLSGLTSPEAIAFDPRGSLYATEDVQNGRLVRVDPDGGQVILTEGLDAPEGAVWSPDGHLYITESNAQFVENLPWDVVTGIRRISPEGTATTVLTDTLLWSYSALALGADGNLYVGNDASNELLTDSIFRVDPSTGQRALFASGLLATEGLAFSPGGVFPLYAVEENLGGGQGRLSLIGADGSHAPLCTGFATIEDVAVDAAGNLYVSEDRSGWIVQILVPDLVVPPPLELAADPPGWTPTNTYTLTWKTPLDPSGIVGAYVKIGDPPGSTTDGTFYAGEGITQVIGIAVPGSGRFPVYVWLEDGSGNVDRSTAASTMLDHDAEPPKSVTSVPTTTHVAPISVAWTATDAHSGVDSVALWVKAGEDGSWVDSGLTDRAEGGGEGLFLYPPAGEGTYYFATVAVDRVGHAEPAPTAEGGSSTYCETWQRAYLPLVWKTTP
jgi:sugar lactone lactonase YvrE